MITTAGQIRHGLMAVTALAALACNGALSPDPKIILSERAALGLGNSYSAWSTPINVEAIPGTHPDFNSNLTDGCPFVAPNGKVFLMASNRAGSMNGSIDIWMSTRESESDPWGEPQNVGAPINSTADDFCPTLTRDGHLLYFVSRRSGGCGQGDIYVARRRAGEMAFGAPELLPCTVNSPFDEFSPFPVEEPGGPALYFSSFRPGGFAAEAPGASADADIYRSPSRGGVFGAATLVPAVNSVSDDAQPNVSRDGLELYFYSSRVEAGAFGMADLYVSTRSSIVDAWSSPSNLGPTINTAAGENRPSLSWDGTTLYFGSSRPGGNGQIDVYVTTRQRLSSGSH